MVSSGSKCRSFLRLGEGASDRGVDVTGDGDEPVRGIKLVLTQPSRLKQVARPRKTVRTW